ncbi:zinc-dependent alcohol dehydrogenase family protein [Porticoccus sp.]
MAEYSLPATMRAMVFHGVGQPLQRRQVPVPEPAPDQLLIRVRACGICRTDLHIVDGELDEPVLPLVPGHQIVGEVVALGSEVGRFSLGQRIGVPWLGGSCGHYEFCQRGRENLCDRAQYTGYQLNGGMAEYAVARADFCFPLPDHYSDIQVAPLLCAGLIGYRAYRMAGEGRVLGLYGFGAAAHILIQVARADGRKVFAITRDGDSAGQAFARSLGASWAGGASDGAPELMDAAIIFAPAGELVPQALQAVRKGGSVICGGIHMSDIPGFPYRWLWGERRLQSVANLTRRDGEEFLPRAAAIPVHTRVTRYPLEQAWQALEDLRCGRFSGAAVLAP